MRNRIGFVSTLAAVVAVRAIVFAAAASACPQAQLSFAPACGYQAQEVYQQQAVFAPAPQYFVQPQAVPVYSQSYGVRAFAAPSYGYSYGAGASFSAGYGGGVAVNAPGVSVNVGRRGLFDRIQDRRTARQVGRAARANVKAAARGVVPLQAVPIY